MAVFTAEHDISIIYDAISFNAGIEIYQGNPSQAYNAVTGEYVPSRKPPFEPCIITPRISVSDPDKALAAVQISEVKYYMGAPMNDSSNLIVTDDDFTLVTSAPTSDKEPPKWSLIVKKDFSPEQPAEIYAVIYFVDTRMYQTIKAVRSILFSTVAFQASAMTLELDRPSVTVINPLEMTSWWVNIKAVLKENSVVVPTSECYFKWMINEPPGAFWREISAEELETYVTGKVGGRWGDTLSFDARYYSEVNIRCIADHVRGAYPSQPGKYAIHEDVYFMRQYPENLTFEIQQLSGAKLKSDMTTQVKFTCQICDGKGLIEDDKYKFFTINWIAKSSKPNTAEKTLGHGREVTFAPSALGFDKNYGMSIYAKIEMKEDLINK